MNAFLPPNGAVRYEVRGAIAYITLSADNPKQTVTAAVHADLKECWLEINRDDAVSVAIVTGSGEVFATGIGILPELDKTLDGASPSGDWVGTFQNRRYATSLPGNGGYRSQFGMPNRAEGEPSKPLIAAVNGLCSGEGLRLLENCDFAIASTTAEFDDPHVSAALAATEEAFGMIRFRNLPRADALRIALMGRRFRMNAGRARQLGLITEIVEPENLLTRAKDLAEAIASFPALAVRATCAAVWDTWSLPYNEARYWSESFTNQVRQSQEAREAILAMVKRRPVWTGR